MTRQLACERCARGLTAVALVVGLTTFNCAAAQSDDKLPTGEKILDKSIKGRGGREAFEKLQSRVSKGSLEITGGQRPSGKLALTFYEAAPNKQHRIVELGGGNKVESGSDGEVYWEIQGGKARIKEDEEKDLAERGADFHALINWRDHYSTVECVGKEVVDGHPCYKVVLTPILGPPESRYFDRRNGLPIKMETMQKVDAGEVPVEYYYDDYREVDGVKLPFKITRKMSTQGQVITTITTWDSIEHNTEIPDEEFSLPPDVKKLVEKPKGPARPPGKGKGG